tara:strand:+ start:27 stop:410 length:384 start_codon:yes stop_codon:yes gene_type:complete
MDALGVLLKKRTKKTPVRVSDRKLAPKLANIMLKSKLYPLAGYAKKAKLLTLVPTMENAKSHPANDRLPNIKLLGVVVLSEITVPKIISNPINPKIIVRLAIWGALKNIAVFIMSSTKLNNITLSDS